MLEYDLHQLRAAELLRRAEQERLAREAVQGRRATVRTAESESHTGRTRRLRFPRTA
ncbi:hypothetical protein [Streptomyces flavalbus]|uniref:Uncharacterized protein n=1 Tax=Streptomyces flavalbus TaxID=2665155 RepID=A0ABW2WFY6_9ACTN